MSCKNTKKGNRVVDRAKCERSNFGVSCIIIFCTFAASLNYNRRKPKIRKRVGAFIKTITMAYKIEQIEGVGDVYQQKLNAVGIQTTDDLLKQCAKKAGRAKLAEQTEISEKLILKWTNHSDLFRVKGVAGQFAELLEAASFVRDRYFCPWFASAKAMIPGGVCASTEKVYSAAPGLSPETLETLSPEERAVTAYLLKKGTAVRRTRASSTYAAWRIRTWGRRP